ncbi:hypothetical protein ES703_34504 [subsurface metagenome]
MNTNDFNRLYRRTIPKKSDGAAIISLELDPVKPRVFRTLTHVTVENKTTAYTKCRLAIKNVGRVHYLDELASPAAGELAVSRSDILLGEQDIFFAEMTGTTIGDELILTAIGWEQDLHG